MLKLLSSTILDTFPHEMFGEPSTELLDWENRGKPHIWSFQQEETVKGITFQLWQDKGHGFVTLIKDGKHAVSGTHSIEYEKDGIRVVCVNPNIIGLHKPMTIETREAWAGQGTVTVPAVPSYIHLGEYTGLARSYTSWVLRQLREMGLIRHAEEGEEADIVITSDKSKDLPDAGRATMYDLSNMHERTIFEKDLGLWG